MDDNTINTTNSKKVIFRLDPKRIKNAKRIALETDRSLAKVFLEAMDLLAEKYKDLIKTK